MQDEVYLMWLSRVQGMTGRQFSQIMSQFDSAEEVFSASRTELRVCGVDEKIIPAIERDQNDGLLASYVRELRLGNIRFMSRFNDSFPVHLKEIPSPPAGLYIIGEMPGNDIPKVSVIGSRRCSEYGLTTAHRLSRDLAAHGVVIVSGMARGIDSQAHRGALEAGGQTIAVMGCGVDICYPPENRALKESIIRSGCVVSEYPPGTKPLPAYFPARNRIISGLCSAVVVVEAARRSGTSITVDQALNQGREVFAVPGNVTSRLSEGTNDLIKQGAVLITDYRDVLNNLGLPSGSDEKESRNINVTETLKPAERLVYGCIGAEPVDLDAIAQKCGLPVQQASALLFTLEIEGLIKKLPGQRYIRE